MRFIAFTMLLLPAQTLQAVSICSDEAVVQKAGSGLSCLTITYSRNVVVTLDDGTSAHADEAFVDTRSDRVTLRGNVCVMQAGGKSHSDEVVFDINAKQLTSTGSKHKPVETKINLAALFGKKHDE